MSRRRESYFKYLQSDGEATVKVPRQTIWNKRRRVQNAKNHVISNDENSEYDCVSAVDISVVTNNDSNLIDLDESIVSTQQCDENISIVSNENTSHFSNASFDDIENVPLDESASEVCADYLKKIHDSLECTVIDAYTMIYAYSVRHSLNWTQTEDLVRLINSVVGEESLNPSKYMFKKVLKPKKQKEPRVHLFCHVCEKYLGTKENLTDSVCPSCGNKICSDTKYKKNHFVAIPTVDHIRNVLEQNSAHLTFNVASSDRASDGNICDVHDSENFRHLKRKMGDKPYITFTLYTDGAPVFKSAKHKSVWPICLYINEIDLTNRFKRQNIICAAVSFGAEPNMQIFFKPLIKEINEINANGGITFRDECGELKTVSVIPMIFTADALAKASVLNQKQHNGYFGCPLCLHPGEKVAGTKQIRYCNNNRAPIRTNREARANMIEAHETDTIVNGYKGLSPLMAFSSHFDVIWQVVIDRMHCVDMGVLKRLFYLFLSIKFRNERYD